MESPVSAHDEFHLCLKIGDPAGQATLELLAFLVAIRLWAGMFRCKARKLLIKSDSSAALAAVGRLASGVAVLNFLVGEIYFYSLAYLFCLNIIFTHFHAKKHYFQYQL